MKQRYFIEMSYKGTAYHGWQSQPNSLTVQSILENALATATREKIETTGAGRTDTGVHARFFVAHFDCSDQNLDNNPGFIYSLNGILPEDIAVHRIFKVKPDAHARFSAVSRTYEYHISKIKNPFEIEFSWVIHGRLNVERMNEAAELLKNYEDFTSFSKLHSNTGTNICKISYARWEESDNKLIFTIKADRFLRNMVRATVGTLVDIGREKIKISDLVNIIESQDREKAVDSAPACGLFLTKIEYHVNIY
jgi:tRNA pseudouridine38-40 synthase